MRAMPNHADPIALRQAGAADASAVVSLVSALLVELGGKPLADASAFEAMLARPELGFVFLAESGGAPAAVCTVSLVHALRASGRYAIVQEMYVTPALRSTGLGAQLLARALAHARGLGCPFVELGTPLGGERQIAFYRRNGFFPVGERLRCVLA
jgi:GNAT superfamily N-acetyltransferase